MMVRYVRERGYKGEGNDPYLTMNETYIVFFIIIGSGSSSTPSMVSVACNSDGEPGMFELQYFDITDQRIPLDWGLHRNEGGWFLLSPKEHLIKSLNLYDDRNEVEELIFQKLKEKLTQFHKS